MYDFVDVLLGVFFTFLVIAVVVGVVFGVIFITGVPSRKTCETYARLNPELSFDYTYWTGCLVKADNGKWVTRSEYMQYYGDLHTLQMGGIGE